MVVKTKWNHAHLTDQRIPTNEGIGNDSRTSIPVSSSLMGFSAAFPGTYTDRLVFRNIPRPNVLEYEVEDEGKNFVQEIWENEYWRGIW